MRLTAVVKERLAQGDKAAPGDFIDLLDGMDDIEELFEAYLSLRDQEHAPGEKPAPLTTEVLKSYVRRINDAVRSTDEAEDAFNTGVDGQLTKTGVMKYVDQINPFELQLVAGRLVKTVHKVQSGTLSIPSWPVLTALKLHKFKTFPARMEKVIVALETRKTICKALFFDELSMMQRVAMQPEEEARKKGTNVTGNNNRNTQLQYARDNMPKAEEPGTATPGTGGGEDEQEADADDEDSDKEMAPPKSKRARRTPADVAVTINPVTRRVKKPTTAQSAQPAVKTTASIQPATPAASTPASAVGSSQPALSSVPAPNNTAVSIKPRNKTGTAFTPINAGTSSQRVRSAASTPNKAGGSVNTAPSTPSTVMKTGRLSQPTTPTPVKASRSKQNNNLFVGPALVNQDAQMQAVLAAGAMGKGELLDNFKFPGQLGKPMAQYGHNGPQTAGPGVNEQPPAYTPGQYYFPQEPQQAQSSGHYIPHQSQSPGYLVADQQAFYGLQQSGRQGYNPSEANQQFPIQGSQGGLGQNFFRHQPLQHGQITGVHHGQGNVQHGHTTHLHRKGQVVRSQRDGKMSGSPHGQIGAVQRNRQTGGSTHHGHSFRNAQMARIRLNGPNSYVVNHYYQSQMPGDSAGQAFPFTHREDDQYADYQKTKDCLQVVLPYQEVEYAKTLDDDDADFNMRDFVNSSPATPTSPQSNYSAAPTEVGDDDTPAAPITASPDAETSPQHEDEMASEDCYDSEEKEVHRLKVTAGLVPEKGTEVFTGDIKMFPSPSHDSSFTGYELMRSPDNLMEEANPWNDENEYEDSEYL